MVLRSEDWLFGSGFTGNAEWEGRVKAKCLFTRPIRAFGIISQKIFAKWKEF